MLRRDVTSIDEIETELAVIEAELRRRRYALDPVQWFTHVLGDHLWSAQRRIAESVRTHRKTSVKSCHGVGKSFISAGLCGWWIGTRTPGSAFVVTSAPSGNQVKAILWREIARVHERGKLPGRLNKTEWYLDINGREELVAFGRKPADYNPTAFQGIHAPEVLVIFDEADGMPTELFDAGDSLTANNASRMLVIGNPDNPSSEFRRICQPGSGWNVITINAFDSPNFTGESLPQSILDQLVGFLYVEEKRRKWAPLWSWNAGRTRVLPPEGLDPLNCAHPYWYSKVLGEFPVTSSGDNYLIPSTWLKEAQERTLPPGEPIRLGVDVGAGGDSTTICHRRGGHFRIIHEDHNPDTMETCGNVIATLKRLNAELANVDMIGIGRGVVDRAMELGEPIIGVNVAEAAFESEAFVNLRAELWWRLRERFETGTIDLDPNDEDLATELIGIRYKRTSSGKIQIESKGEMKSRGLRSPNRAEALMLANADVRAVGDFGITI